MELSIQLLNTMSAAWVPHGQLFEAITSPAPYHWIPRLLSVHDRQLMCCSAPIDAMSRRDRPRGRSRPEWRRSGDEAALRAFRVDRAQDPGFHRVGGAGGDGARVRHRAEGRDEAGREQCGDQEPRNGGNGPRSSHGAIL